MAKSFRRILEISFLAMIAVWVSSRLEAQVLSPKYDRLIEGDLALPGGGIAQFLIRENDALVVRTKGRRDWYGMMPMAGDRSEPGLVFFKISHAGGMDRIDRLGDRAEISVSDFEAVPRVMGDFEIHINGIKLCKSGSSGSYQNIYGEDALCCVTCDGITVCGSAVSMNCDSCGPGGGHLVM
jgi:hypothetical protein